MAVQFILGTSGTGKTRWCIDSIIEALVGGKSEQPLIFLVPEQATYQAERAILSDERIPGYHRLHVLSFDRLQFMLLGKSTARPRLSRIARQMIVQRILSEQKDNLKILGASVGSRGLAGKVADVIAELHNYAKTAEDVDDFVQKLRADEPKSLSALKYADISTVLKRYLEFIADRFVDPALQLVQAREAVGKSELVKGARLWVDGFAGFTGTELEILAELLRNTGDAHIALCLDPSRIDLKEHDSAKVDPVSIFYPTERTYAELLEVTRRSKLQIGKPVILREGMRFSGRRDLAHIEKNLFEAQPPKIAAEGNVRIIAAPSARAEARFAARQICELVRDAGFRYRDIAVIASDMETYQHYVSAYFNDYEIPFFLDRRKPLDRHPLVKLICSAMEAVTGEFESRPIFAYSKTGLVPLDEYDIDLLENYCIAFGVTGADWARDGDWRFAGQEHGRFSDARINDIRRRTMGPLLELKEKLSGAGGEQKKLGPAEFVRVIFDFLEKLRVQETIGSWIEEAANGGDRGPAQEHRQFYDGFVDIFDALTEVFKGCEMSCAEYLSILTSAFSQFTLAFIPPTLDQVLVGSIERSRHPELKAVFLLGATQKQFPTPVRYDSLLNEKDRQAAEAAGFALAPCAAQTLAERQYLAYIAYTRPSQLLYVSYPASDEKGGAAVRSPFVDSLLSLFTNLEEESISERNEIEQVRTRNELAETLCCALGRDKVKGAARRDTEGLLEAICGDNELGDVGHNVAGAVGYANKAALEKDVVDELFGGTLRTSATRLSTFAACPYKYFAQYTLGLKKREEFKFEPIDVGVFYHLVLDRFFVRLRSLGKDMADTDDAELLKVLAKVTEETISSESFISNFANHSAHNMFIIASAAETLEEFVPAIAAMCRAGDFRQVMAEATFGEDTDVGGKCELAAANGLSILLRGKIDRVDVAELGGRKAAVVFDYKRRAKSFSWGEFYHGLDMQLPVYMLAVRRSERLKGIAETVAGGFYIPVEAPAEIAGAGDLSGTEGKFSRKAKGIFNGELAFKLERGAQGNSTFYSFYVGKDGQPYGSYANRNALTPSDFEAVLRATEKKMAELASRIHSGEIAVRPYKLAGASPCAFCDYRAVCRFDWQVNEYNFLESVKKPKVLERIGEGNG